MWFDEKSISKIPYIILKKRRETSIIRQKYFMVPASFSPNYSQRYLFWDPKSRSPSNLLLYCLLLSISECYVEASSRITWNFTCRKKWRKKQVIFRILWWSHYIFKKFLWKNQPKNFYNLWMKIWFKELFWFWRNLGTFIFFFLSAIIVHVSLI